MVEKVVVKRVGELPKVENVAVRDLGTIQSIVEGNIQTVPCPEKILMVVNEEGMIKNLPINFVVNEMPLYGNVYFCSCDDEDFIGLNDEQIKWVLNMFENI